MNRLSLRAFVTWWQEQKMKKAFTLIELMVAVGILAIILSFAGVIFNASIETHRTALANAEIMQKLRAITNQLDADFGGTIRTSPGIINIETRGRVKADRIAFLAIGDFQSVRQYGYIKSDGSEALKTVSGIVASIFYGQAGDAHPGIDPNTDPFTGDPKEKILLRRQTILTSDSSLLDSNSAPLGEYYKCSLAEWDANLPFDDANEWSARPDLDPHLEKDLVMYMAKGVDNFTIKRFVGIGGAGSIIWRRPASGSVSTEAFKFTFTLYDSKGIIERGRTFTHIVYLD